MRELGEFKYRIKEYEARSADVHNLNKEPYHHIDVVRWVQDRQGEYCYSVAIITPDEEGEDPEIRSIGSRIWDCDLRIIKTLYWAATEFMIGSCPCGVEE